MTRDSLAKTAKLAKKSFCLGIPWRSWRLGESFSLLLILCMSAADADTLGTVSSPSNVLSVSVCVDNEGRPGYSITRAGRPIVTESRLGFLLTDAPKLERNFRGDGVQTRTFDETWEQPWGERRAAARPFASSRCRERKAGETQRCSKLLRC